MIDKGKIYKDGYIQLTDTIGMNVPTIGEIFDFGEQRYFSLISTLCSDGFDYKWQLDEMGIDFETIDDYDLFLGLLCPSLTNDYICILFGDELDFSKMNLVDDRVSGRKKLFQIADDKLYTFDYATYHVMVSYLRMIHGMERSFEKYANPITKKYRIEDSKMYYESHKNDEYKPYLFNLVSAMVNSSGFPRNDSNVWDMNIFAFLDSVKRIQKIKNADLLLQSGYSGFGVSLKEIDKKELDWLGEL